MTLSNKFKTSGICQLQCPMCTKIYTGQIGRNFNSILIEHQKDFYTTLIKLVLQSMQVKILTCLANWKILYNSNSNNEQRKEYGHRGNTPKLRYCT